MCTAATYQNKRFLYGQNAWIMNFPMGNRSAITPRTILYEFRLPVCREDIEAIMP